MPAMYTMEFRAPLFIVGILNSIFHYIHSPHSIFRILLDSAPRFFIFYFLKKPKMIKERRSEKRLTIKDSNLLPDVAVVIMLLKIEDGIARRTVAAVVELKNSLILVC